MPGRARAEGNCLIPLPSLARRGARHRRIRRDVPQGQCAFGPAPPVQTPATVRRRSTNATVLPERRRRLCDRHDVQTLAAPRCNSNSTFAAARGPHARMRVRWRARAFRQGQHAPGRWRGFAPAKPGTVASNCAPTAVPAIEAVTYARRWRFSLWTRLDAATSASWHRRERCFVPTGRVCKENVLSDGESAFTLVLLAL